jgi:beta-glucosidase
MRLAVFTAALSGVAVGSLGEALAETPPAQAAPAAVAEESRARAAALVAQMTLDEKVEQLLNVAPAIPRLGVPAYNWWTESLHGAIGEIPTTNFPEPIGLAATFDAPLVHEVAGAVSVEVQALHTRGRATGRLGRIGTGLDTWSPNINIFRDPRWGRGQETYGEDPYLTARMGVAFVTGMQGPNPELPNVISTPKHFAVHSGPESTRHKADVFVSPHDLEDTYLPAFRAAIVEGHAGSVMCAYNRIDGQPACASDLLLKDHLRGAWNFTGYVVSDCDAVTDIDQRHHYATDPAAGAAAALKAGVDNECNTQTLGGATGLGERYKEAYRRGLISMADIDQALVRLFSARYRNGDLPGMAERSPSRVAESEVLTPAHRALALRTAEESLVLLKNDGVLPLKPGLKILVIGPHGDSTHVLRGNYSSPQSAPPISVVDGLRQAMPGAKIVQAPFEPTLMDGDRVPDTALRTPDGQPGLKVERAGAEEVRTGFLIPPESGTYRIGLTGVAGELELDGKSVGKLEAWSWGELPTLWTVPLEKGRRYRLRIVSKGSSQNGDMLMWKRIDAQWEDHLKTAAADADVIVAAVGISSDLEGEESPRQTEGFSGGDRTSLDLPAPQRRLLEQAKALGKPLVVVLMNGSAIDLSWETDNASAILEAWYPGQAGGLAVADVLTGKSDPGGRLPLTFYRSVADLPPFDDYAMKGRTYRYFEGKPVYPFGYGLSYTRFAYTVPVIEPASGGFETGARVTTTVSNTGGRSGEEVAELYLKPPAFEGAPRLALRGFRRLSLAPGESRTVTFELSPRDLSFVTRDGQRQTMTGRYEVSVGSGQPDTGVPVQSAGFAMDKAVPIAP